MDSDQPPEQVADQLSDLETRVDQQTSQIVDDLTGLGESIEQVAVTEVKEQLGELETAVERIPSPDPSPKTTLQLQSQADVEGAWQNYLQYFLNPDAYHGLGKEALVQFLRGLDAAGSQDFPTRLSDDVVVKAEVSSPNDNRPDIIIQDPGEFFVCCELKLYSSEGQNQTERYVEDDYIGKIQKSNFPEHSHHYVYVKRPDSLGAEADEFVNLTWRQVREWFQPLLLNNQGRYPSRTASQLSDFLDTIHQDMTQDEHMQIAQEKMQLYFNHQEAIEEAKRAVDTVYEYELDNWRRHFMADYLPNNWGQDWYANSNRYGQIYHTKWRQDGELAIENANVKMHFVHLIRDKESFEHGRLTMQLRWPKESPYRERFKELFVSERFAEKLDPRLAENGITKRADYSYSNPRFMEKVYSVVKTDLPESYYETLQQAAREHIEIAPVINEILDRAIEEVEADL